MTARGLLIAAWDAVRADRMRAALNAVGVVIGVLAITSVIAVGDIADRAIVAEIERTSGRAATLEIALAEEPSGGGDAWDSVRAHLLARRGSGGVREVSAMLPVSGRLRLDAAEAPASVIGVDPTYASVRRLGQEAGRWLDREDASLYALPLVVNLPLARELGLHSGDVGRPLTVVVDGPVRGVLVGIVEDGQSEPVALTTLDNLRRWTDLSAAAQPPRFLALVEPSRDAIAAHAIEAALRPSAPGVTVLRLDNVEQVRRVIRIAQLAISGIGVLAIAISILGIVNSGLASIRERGREFAIRRSFGASTRDIFRLVLLEATILGLSAGIVGVALSLVASRLVLAVLDLPITAEEIPRFPLWAALLGVAVATVAGALGGFAPARRATRTSVVAAIRR